MSDEVRQALAQERHDAELEAADDVSGETFDPSEDNVFDEDAQYERQREVRKWGQ
jgi:hypothetical protein